jgi:hypothetical protein
MMRQSVRGWRRGWDGEVWVLRRRVSGSTFPSRTWVGCGGGGSFAAALTRHMRAWVRVARQNEARARRALLSSFDMCAHVCNVRLCLVLCTALVCSGEIRVFRVRF